MIVEDVVKLIVKTWTVVDFVKLIVEDVVKLIVVEFVKLIVGDIYC